jgi:hypothetical protein
MAGNVSYLCIYGAGHEVAAYTVGISFSTMITEVGTDSTGVFSMEVALQILLFQ